MSKDKSQAIGSLVLLQQGGLPRTVSVDKEAGHDWEGFQQHVRSWKTMQRKEGERRSCGKACTRESGGDRSGVP